MKRPVTIVQPRLRLEDPHDSTDANDVLTVFDAVFDALVRYGRDEGYVPALAERWSVSPDARHWTFHLRAGVHFHDGEPLDAAAVVLSLKRMARPDKGYTLGAPGVHHQYLGDADIAADGRHTVRIKLTKPVADLLDVLVYGYVVAPASIEALERGDRTRMVGTGPYRMERYEAGRELHLLRNDAYFAGPPANERLVYRLEADAGKRLAMLSSGEAEVANSLAPQAADGLDRSGWTVRHFMTPVAIIYLLNAQKGSLRDPRIRAALNLAIDREAIVREVMQGAATPLHGFVSPLHFGAAPDRPMPHDPARARVLLAEAGLADGLLLTVDCPTSLPDEAQALTECIGRQLSAIGVRLEVRLHTDREAYAHGVRRKEIHDLCVFDSSPLSTFRVLYEKIDSRIKGSWWQGYSNEAVETLLDRARSCIDDKERAELYRRCYGLLQDDPAWLYLYNPHRTIALAGSHPQWRMRRDGVIDALHLPAMETA